jgi:hypothetical protein
MPPTPDGDLEAHHQPETGRDFDDSANALWKLYGQEAKNYDHATIKDIKSDMGGLLIFVRPSFFHSPSVLSLIALMEGWLVFRRPHRVHHRS